MPQRRSEMLLQAPFFVQQKCLAPCKRHLSFQSKKPHRFPDAALIIVTTSSLKLPAVNDVSAQQLFDARELVVFGDAAIGLRRMTDLWCHSPVLDMNQGSEIQ